MKERNFYGLMCLGIVMLIVGTIMFGVDIAKHNEKDMPMDVVLTLFGVCMIIVTAFAYNPGEPKRFLRSGKKYYKHGQEVRITEGASLGGKEFTLVWLRKGDYGEILGYKLEVKVLLDKNQQPISVIPNQFMVLKYQDKYHLIEIEVVKKQEE